MKGVTASQEVIADVIEEIKNGLAFIKADYPLILNWAERVKNVDDELKDVEVVIELVKSNEINDLIDVLDALKQACQDYLKHCEGNILIDATTEENIWDI